MKKSTAILEGVVIGGLVALIGLMINLLAIPLFGELPLVNLIAIFVCFLIGVGTGIFIYISNREFIKK